MPREASKADLQGCRGLPDRVHGFLREAILDRRLESGEQLRQEEIAAKLGVSRLPVREALQRLTAEGLAVLRPNRGYFVAGLSAEEIEEVFDIRALLEERAGYLATVRRTADDVAAIRDILERLDRVAEADILDVVAFGTLNREFHETLFAVSGRNQLCRLMRTLRDNVERYARLGASMAGSLASAQQEHHDIFAAFATGSAEEAGRLCRLHCQRTGERLLAHIRAGPALSSMPRPLSAAGIGR